MKASVAPGRAGPATAETSERVPNPAGRQFLVDEIGELLHPAAFPRALLADVPLHTLTALGLLQVGSPQQFLALGVPAEVDLVQVLVVQTYCLLRSWAEPFGLVADFRGAARFLGMSAAGLSAAGWAPFLGREALSGAAFRDVAVFAADFFAAFLAGVAFTAFCAFF